MIHTSNPLCVALDELEPDANEAMADRLTDVVGMLKLGLTGFVAGGPALRSRELCATSPRWGSHIPTFMLPAAPA